jgi:hypothetical protein
MEEWAAEINEGITLKQRIYDHGGSRIWQENAKGERQLIADTYEDKHFAAWLFDQIRDQCRRGTWSRL